MKGLRSWLAFGISGLLIGICLSVGLAGMLLANRAANVPAALRATEAAATRSALSLIPAPAGTLTRTVVERPGQTATRESDALFALADQLFQQRKPQTVIDLLQPKLQELQGIDLAKAYDYLGDAECLLGHYQLGAAYFNKRQAIDPTFKNLWKLGVAYDAGGDLDRAYEVYTTLIESKGQDADEFRAAAEQRRQGITQAIGTPTPKR